MGFLMSKNVAYRPDIDVLRALAVLMVVFYHLGFSFISGGFIGVDIFFVISGFLITSIIKKSLDNKAFSFLEFYENRIRRIFPALIGLCIITMIAFYLIYADPVELRPLQRSLKRALLTVSNFFFYENTGYFDQDAETMPLLHTWSLGVEMQFYFFFPFIIYFIHKKFPEKVMQSVIVLAITSFIFSAGYVFVNQSFTFYMLPTRAWELLLGSLLSLSKYSPKTQNGKRNFILIGFFCIMFPALTYGTVFHWPFPGAAALLPCLGSVLFISGGKDYSTPSFLLKCIRAKSLYFIGLISYSLYLWHWPLIVFYKSYDLKRELTNVDAISLFLLSIIFAILSWKFIERPFRTISFFKNRKVLYISLIIGISLPLLGASHFRNPSIAIHPLVENVRHSVDFSRSKEELGSQKKIDILFLGDSHLLHWAKSLERLAQEHQATFYAAESTLKNTTLQNLDATIWEDIESFISKKSIQTAVLSFRWFYRLTGKNTWEKAGNYDLVYDNGFQKYSKIEGLYYGLKDTLEVLQKAQIKKVYVTLPLPEPHKNVLFAYGKLLYRGLTVEEISEYTDEKVEEYQERVEPILDIFSKLQKEFPFLHIIDSNTLLLDAKKQAYKTVHNGTLLYYDDDHLSIKGAEFLEKSWIPIFENIQ